MLKEFMLRNLDTSVAGMSTERLYFWKDLKTIRKDWNARLVRIFKPRYYSFLAENTDKSGMFSGKTKPGEELDLPYFIYHYSRVDSDPMKISRRVRNLDGFFHPEDSLLKEKDLPEYDFVLRPYDNFSKKGMPEEKEGEIYPFSGTHPAGIVEWYSKE